MRIYNKIVILFIPFILFPTLMMGQNHDPFFDYKNLQQEWMVFVENEYRPFTEENDNNNVNTIYFWIEVNQYRGQYLRIRSLFQPSVFINGRLAGQCYNTITTWRIDSLQKVYSSSTLLVALHQKKILAESLHTTIASRGTQSALEEDFTKPVNFFKDFVIVAALILLIILVLIMQLNPKLSSDYFSVTRIFSVRESDDNQLYSRITSSSNLLFYSYCSLVFSFYLMMVFHYVAPQYDVAWPFHAESFGSALLQWLKLSALLLLIYFIKIFLVYLSTRLFGLQEIFGLHVFNWIRLMLLVFGALSVLLVLYHIVHEQDAGIYTTLLWLVAWVFIGWIIIVFPKVMRRAKYSMFHIFSYICATEIIPLLISIKIIYY